MQRDYIFTLCTLFYCGVVHFGQRNLTSIVCHEVNKQLQINNWKYGLLHTGCMAGYSVGSIAFGFVGDRYSWRYPLLVGISISAFSTLFVSFFPTYWFFLLFRVIFGIGESSFLVVVPAILCRICRAKRRLLVFSIFYCAMPTGYGLAHIFGVQIMKSTLQWQRVFQFIVLFNIASIFGGSVMSLPYFVKHCNDVCYIDDVCDAYRNKTVWIVAFVNSLLTSFFESWLWFSNIYTGKVRRNESLQSSLISGFGHILFGIAGIFVGAHIARQYTRIYRNLRPTIIILASEAGMIFYMVAFCIDAASYHPAYPIQNEILFKVGEFFYHMGIALTTELLVRMLPLSVHCIVISILGSGLTLFGNIHVYWLFGFFLERGCSFPFKNPDHVTKISLANLFLIQTVVIFIILPFCLLGYREASRGRASVNLGTP